jgi:hypothetical protein
MIFFFTLLFGGMFAAMAQDCTPRAMRTVNQQARVAAVSKNALQARQFLRQAESQCPTSADVHEAIAEVYKILGDSGQAQRHRELATRFRSSIRTPISFAQRAEDPDEKPSYVRKKWALIVGVGRFQDRRITTLDYTVKDAMDFAAVLRDPNVGRFTDAGEYFQVLTDEQATTDNIRTAINNIAQKADKDDLVVLYFSSHGSDAKMDAAADGTGYIVTHNTNLNNLYGTAFSMEELVNVVDRRFMAERVVAFLDTCYSGGTISRSKTTRAAVSPNYAGISVAQAKRGARALFSSDGETDAETQSGARALAITHDETTTETVGESGARALAISFDESARVAQGRGRIVIASSQNDEMSWESDSYANGYFTFYLMEAMRQQNGFKNVTQLFDSLRGNVLTAVKRDKGEIQTPVIDPGEREISIVIGTAVQ